MNFIVSFFLALTASLATLALQSCNDGLDVNGGVVAVCSVFAIILALYFVDYKKTFAISHKICNVLLVVAVLSQSGSLFRSRQDFLAFSIANILALIQAVIFFQKKTPRIACQILVISLVEIAVGCVFQRDLRFVATVPLYVLSAFLSLSLLFLNAERDYYARHIALKERFSKRKEKRANLKKKNQKESELTPDASLLASASTFLNGASALSVSNEKFLFFACPSSAPYGIAFEYFKRFALWSVGGALFAAAFFCLFPRLNQIGCGPIQFEEVDWGAAKAVGFAQTGFSSTIELGDLGPTLDSYEQVATVQFYALDGLKRSETLDSNSPVYFRGVALAQYFDRQWSEIREYMRIPSANLLTRMLRAQMEPQNFRDVVPEEILNAAKKQESAPPSASQRVDRWGRPFEPYPFPPANRSERRDSDFAESFRAPVLGYNPKRLSDVGSIKITESEDERGLLDELKKQFVPIKNAIQYDSKSDVIALKMEAEPSNSPFVFHIRPFFVVKGYPPLVSTCASSVTPRRASKREFVDKRQYWFVTPAFHDGRQDVLTPNQENVWEFFPYYLTFDFERLPRLTELARQWDLESGCDKNNFIERAKFLEGKLRDSGLFKYNRTGVLRDPSLDPLEDFVAERREGHCEYFAGALTLMLRAVGIPSRIVVGYACNVESKSKKIVVRQSDAHSWVEAYIPPKQLAYAASNSTSNLNVDPNAEWLKDGAWLRLDPTPAAERAAERPGALAVGASDLSSLVQSLSRDFVLNFNGARQQRKIYAPIVETYRAFTRFVSSLKNAFVSNSASQGGKKFNWLRAFLLVCLCVATRVLWIRCKNRPFAFLRKRPMRNGGKNKAQRKEFLADKGTIALFLQIAQALERKLKIKRRQGETPLEFAARCLETEKNCASTTSAAENEPINDVITLAQNYYLATFGNVPISSQEKKRWKEFLRALSGSRRMKFGG